MNPKVRAPHAPEKQPLAGSGPPDARPALTRRHIVFTMGGLMLALFLSSLDQTIVSTAMPRIVTDLGGFDRFTWITTAYLVASTTFVPIVGRLSDLYGRKSFFLGGIIIFLVGSVLAGSSQTMDQLIGFRALQGLGGGAIMAMSFTTVGDLFSPQERGKYQGYLAAVFGLSSVIGPTLGGVITDFLSWNWIFYVNVPLGLIVVVLFVRFFPNLRPRKRQRRLDYAGMVLLVATVVPLLVGLSLAGVNYAWLSPQVIGVLALALVMLAAFIVVERRAADPIMPPQIFSNRIVSISIAAVFITGFAMFGAIIFVPLFFQGVLGASATSSGSFLTPMMLSMVVAAALAGQALSRFGGHYRTQGLIGIGIMLAGVILLAGMTAETSFVQAVAFISITGIGVGITFPGFSIAVQNSVPHELLGAATSASQFFRSVGGTLGLAVLGSYMANRFASGIATSLPSQITEAIPPSQLAALQENPQALVNPAAFQELQGALAGHGETGPQLAAELVGVLRSVLADAITDVFVVVAVALGLGFVVVIFLREIALSRTRP